jgi:hypothetical protein
MTSLTLLPPERRTAAPVRYGSLTLTAKAKPSVDAAFAYLGRDSVERTLIDRLVNSPIRHHLSINSHDDDSYDPNTRTIHWDPHSALLTTRGGHQTPALGLGHEIDHAVADPDVEQLLANVPDPHYDDLEEKRVVTGSETHAAHTLHESIRSDHSGESYHVTSPTTR